jgi:dolichol-phosphate mannosyltransferase
MNDTHSHSDSSARPLLSIIVPVYNEESTFPGFLREITRVLSQVTENYELIFALDPCRDRTEELIEEANARDPRVKLLKFSRRFGQPAATWGGLCHAQGDAVVIIDCDMQDPPSLIPEMVRLWREGNKVVIPQRRTREGENIIKKTVAYTAYWLINKIASVEIPRNAGDFRLLDRRVVNELIKLREGHGFLRGLTALVGFKTTLLPFDRLPRAGGQGKYNPFTGSFRIGLNGIVAFSSTLLDIIAIAGIVLSFLAVLGAVVLAISKAIGAYEFATGVATLGVIMLLLFGLQFMALGVVGAYISRIYDEVKMRPKFIVDRSLGLEGRNPAAFDELR